MYSALDQVVIVEKRSAKLLAEQLVAIVKVAGCCEWRLTLGQQPPTYPTPGKIGDPTGGAVDSNLAELHQDLSIDQHRIGMEGQNGPAELALLIAWPVIAIVDLNRRKAALTCEGQRLGTDSFRDPFGGYHLRGLGGCQRSHQQDHKRSYHRIEALGLQSMSNISQHRH